MNFNSKQVKYLGLAFGLSLLAGCASSGSHETTEPLTVKLTSFEKVDVTIVNKVPEAEDQVKTIQEQVITKLEPTLALVSLGKDERKTGVLGMRLEIVDFKVIGGAAHFFLGALAGPDRVSVVGTLYDRGTGKKIGSFKSTGEARLGGIVTGNTGTLRASAQLGEEIAALIKSNR